MANNTTIAVITPVQVTVTAATAAALDTAVATQVNTYIQAYLNPKNTGNPPGTVVNESIVVSESHIAVLTNGTSTYYATVSCQQWVLPK